MSSNNLAVARSRAVPEEEEAAALLNESVPLDKLPKLLTPLASQRREARFGCGVVCAIIAACVAGTRGGVALMGCPAGATSAFRPWLEPLVYASAEIKV